MGNNHFYCKINGRIHNLEEVQKLIKSDGLNGKVTLYMYENKIFNDIIEADLFEEVIRFNNNEIPADYNECLERLQARNSARVNRNLITCPNCKSTNVQKISGTERAASVLGLGLLSKKIGKSYKCLNCKYTW